jgi:hypothetical protein
MLIDARQANPLQEIIESVTSPMPGSMPWAEKWTPLQPNLSLGYKICRHNSAIVLMGEH